MTIAAPDRADLLGVEVSLVTPATALAAIEAWIAESSRRYVCITGAHGIIESRGDEALRGIHNRADMVTPDGKPLVWLARALGHSGIERVYGPDLMRAVTASSPAKGYRHYYFGGAPGVAETLRERLAALHPGLSVVGTMSPPFRELTPEEDDEVVASINAAAPDLLWIGLSTPKQERWMATHRARLDVPVIVGVGAAFDFLAGLKRQAPPWMGRAGLEWFFRLCTEPGRLWRRYLHIVPAFAFLAGRTVLQASLAGQRKRGNRTGLPPYSIGEPRHSQGIINAPSDGDKS